MELSKFHRWRCELANTMFLRVPQQNLPKYFGHVSVLQTNLAKSSASPIHCFETHFGNYVLPGQGIPMHLSWTSSLLAEAY